MIPVLLPSFLFKVYKLMYLYTLRWHIWHLVTSAKAWLKYSSMYHQLKQGADRSIECEVKMIDWPYSFLDTCKNTCRNMCGLYLFANINLWGTTWDELKVRPDLSMHNHKSIILTKPDHKMTLWHVSNNRFFMLEPLCWFYFVF